jgi:hypothetical protein
MMVLFSSEAMLERAMQNKVEMETTDGPGSIMDRHEIVFGLWPDRREKDGHAVTVLKGRLQLHSAVRTDDKSLPADLTRWTAVLCTSSEHADAICQEKTNRPALRQTR